MKVTGIIMFLMTVIVAKHHHYSIHKSILELKSNFFGQVNEDVHVLMEKIFDCVNLNANFTKESNVKLLLTMHQDLSNIANKNFDVLNEIQNITTVNIDNQTQAMINIDTVVAEELNANNFNVYEKINGPKKNYKYGRNGTKTLFQTNKGNTSSEFGDSKEFLNFVIDFVEKINNLTIQDFKRPSNVTNDFVSFRRNLKVWEPPSCMKIDYFNVTQTRRLYKGLETKVKKFPFVVSIHIMGEFTCAGCIISKDLIVTAASCLQVAYKNAFFAHNPKSIYVRLGSDYTLRDGETIPIHKLYFHPLYDPESLKHNVALVKLERRIRFTKQQKRIRRILWDKTPGKLRDDIGSVLILGWGATKSDQIIDKHQKLRVDILDVYNLKECKEIYSEDFVSDESFCAGFVKTSGGACNGDVGGPGIVGEVLMGVVSFGAPVCGTRDTPTVFTKLGYYTAWIESITGPQGENRESKLLSLYKNTRRKYSGSSKNQPLYSTKLSIKGEEFRAHGEEYPDEVKVLREILNELIQTNNTVVDDLLYGELYDDFKDLFASEEKGEDTQHPLVNKSSVTLPGIHYHSKKDYKTMALTTSTQKPTHVKSTTTHKAHKIKGKHGSDTLKIDKNRIPKSDETDNEIGSDAKKNYDTDNYESTKEHAHGISIEEEEEEKYPKDSEESQENLDMLKGNVKEQGNVKNKHSGRYKQNYNRKKNTLTYKPNSGVTKAGTDVSTDDSDKKELNSIELNRSFENKQLYYSEEKKYESDEHSKALRKDSPEKKSYSQETIENSNSKGSDKKEQNSEESSRNYAKKQNYFSDEKKSESDEHSEELRKSSSEKKPYSQETKEISHTNENIDISDSNSVEYTTLPSVITNMEFEAISAGWGIARPSEKSNKEERKEHNLRSKNKKALLLTKKDRKTTRIIDHVSKKPTRIIEASFEMAFLVNKQKP